MPSPSGGGEKPSPDQEEHADDGKSKAEDDQRDRNKPLMALLASNGAVRDHQQQPKERRDQDSEENQDDPKEDSPDRFHGDATG